MLRPSTIVKLCRNHGKDYDLRKNSVYEVFSTDPKTGKETNLSKLPFNELQTFLRN